MPEGCLDRSTSWLPSSPGSTIRTDLSLAPTLDDSGRVQDEPKGRAEEGVTGLACCCELCLLPNGLGGFKDVGPQKICSWATTAMKGNFAGRVCGSH